MSDEDNSGIGGNFTIPTDNEPSTDSPRASVRKDSDREINRKVLPQTVRSFLKNKQGVQRWETDPMTLKDYAENLLVQSFVDTIAKDVSSVDWAVMSGEDTQDEAESFLRDMHHEKTFSDVVEATVRDLLRTGNAFWVKHRYANSDELAEIAVPDSATMFKITDEKGYCEGYVQKQDKKASEPIPKEDVVHFEWSSSSDRLYALSPVEMCMDEIDIIDELKIKEMLDLIEGGQSGVLTQVSSHDLDPMSGKEWNELMNEIDSTEGSRHEQIVARGDWKWVSTDTSYGDMKLLERYKFHLQSISSAFKVNPSYVGFDFENTNRATDESQKQAYKQRGLKVVLEQLEQKINKNIIRAEFDEDARFIWDIETDDEESKVAFYEQLGKAVQELQEAGVPFEVSDGNITIPEDAELSVEQAEQLAETKVVDAMFQNVNVAELVEKLQDEREDEGCQEQAVELSERKRELLECEECESFTEAMKEIEERFENRTDAIAYVQENLDGTLSQTTYYNWLDECGLK